MFGLRVIAQRMYKFSFSLLLFLFSTSISWCFPSKEIVDIWTYACCASRKSSINPGHDLCLLSFCFTFEKEPTCTRMSLWCFGLQFYHKDAIILFMWCVMSTKHDKKLVWRGDAVVSKSTLQHGMIVATRSIYKLRSFDWVSVFYQYLGFDTRIEDPIVRSSCVRHFSRNSHDGIR
jgi:hypothetical protein